MRRGARAAASRRVIALGGGARHDARIREALARHALHGLRRRRRGHGVGAGRAAPTGRSRSDEAAFRRALRRSGSRSTARSPTRSRPTPTAPCSPPAGVHARAGRARPARRARARRRAGRARRRRARDRASTGRARSRRSATGCRRRTSCRPARRRRALGVARAALERAAARPRRHARRARRRLHDRRRRASRPRPTCAASPWVAVPTTLVGQVDAAIGGKTAIDIPEGKNLVGAFHWPARVVIDRALLDTLPERERRAGHGRGREDAACSPASRRAPTSRSSAAAPRTRPRSACATRTTAGAARWSSTSATRSRTRSRPRRLRPRRTARRSPSACSRRCGSPAATRTPVERELAPQPVRVDRERAWQALRRDKKARDGQLSLVLLDGAPASRVTGVELPEERVRAALDALIA